MNPGVHSPRTPAGFPLVGLATGRGYVLTAMETELERQLRLTQEARQRAEDENKLLRGLLVGRAT